MKRSLTKAAGLIGVVTTLLAGGTTAALADDLGTIAPGCYIIANAPSLNSSKVVYGGTASCSSSMWSFFRLVHDYDGLPDARVAEHTIGGTTNSWSGMTCDNGTATTKYYSEVGYAVAFVGDVQRISTKVTLTHC